MRRLALHTGMAIVVLAGMFPVRGADTQGQAIPLVSQMMGPARDAAESTAVARPNYPSALKSGAAIGDAAEFLPQNPNYFLEIRNGASFANAMENTPVARLGREKAVEQFLKENPISIAALYEDLPAEYGSAGSRALIALTRAVTVSFATTASAVTVVNYPAVGAPDATATVFLADIGRERKEAFDQLQALVGDIMERHGALAWQEAPHDTDYMDVIRAEDLPAARADRFVGIVRNFVFFCDNRLVAERLFVALRDRTAPGAVLADAASFRDMGARIAPACHVRGFFAPSTANLSFIPDEGVAKPLGGSLLYYGMEVTPTGMREQMLVPVSPEGREWARLAEELFAVAEPVDSAALKTPHFFPYQPDAAFIVRLRPLKVRELLSGKTAMPGGVSLPSMLAGNLPGGTWRALLDREDSLLDGELGFAIIRNPGSMASEWLLAAAINRAPEVEKLLSANDTAAKTVSGVPIYCESGRLDAITPATAVFNVLTFRNLPQPLLVMTSSGTVMESLIGQTIGGKANLAMNRDFVRQVDEVKGRNAAVLFVNLPKIMGDIYPDMPAMARAVFPKLPALRNRPPLEIVQKHTSSLAMGLSFTDTSDVVLSLFSPMGVMPTAIVSGVAMGPYQIRQQESEALTQGRITMGRLNVELQLYATRRGHYPPSLEEFEALLDQPKRDQLMTDPGALRRVGAEAARRESYTYVPNLRTSDAPDSILLYSAKPWYCQYSDDEENRVYQSCRLVLRLDGQIDAVSDDQFRQEYLPRVKHME